MSENKVSQLILQLTKATLDKDVKWQIVDPPRSLTRGSDDLVVSYFTAFYKGQGLALMGRRYKSFDILNETTYWDSALALAILDEDQKLLWKHEDNSSALENLFNAARESAVQLDSILDRLLEESAQAAS